MLTVSYGGVTGSVSITVTPAQLTSLTMTPSLLSLRWFASYQLRAYANYTDGTLVDVTTAASWSSSNVVAATVWSGKVYANAWCGDVRIVASYGNQSASTIVTVRLF